MFKNPLLKLYESLDFYWQLKNLNISQWDIENRRQATQNNLTRQQR